MEISYILTVNEIKFLLHILGIFSIDDDIQTERISQTLINKGFLHYNKKEMIVEKSISYILKELSTARCLLDSNELKLYKGMRIFILLLISNKEIKIQIYETLERAKNAI